MSKIKLPHASGGSMSIAAPATNPSGDLELKLPNTVGTGKINHGNVLEQFFTSCDGSAITVPSGTYTVGNVTSTQALTTTHAEVNGSSISYTPPAGTTQVVYEFNFLAGEDIASSQKFLVNYKLQIDGTDVSNSRGISYIEATNYTSQVNFKYAINIGGSTSTTTGRQATWTSAKTLRLMAREWSSAYQGRLFELDYWDTTSGAAICIPPTIGITAIGTPT